ncbi:unnamed protein product [Cochlearia groenlandica]
MDSMLTTTGEAEAWFRAQELLSIQLPVVGSERGETTTTHQGDISEISCFTDGSWKEEVTTSGVGWVLQSTSGV